MVTDNVSLRNYGRRWFDNAESKSLKISIHAFFEFLQTNFVGIAPEHLALQSFLIARELRYPVNWSYSDKAEYSEVFDS